MRALLYVLTSLAVVSGGCVGSDREYAHAAGGDLGLAAAVADARPLTRYWLFAEDVDTLAVAADLDWLAARGFGGVELAFVYPHGRMRSPRDSTPVPRPAWGSPELARVIDFAQRAAQARGLRCDLTGGSLWPFGDPEVPWAQASQRFSAATGGTDTAWRQEITAHWAWPTAGLVVDHLTPAHYLPYLTRTLDAYPDPLGGEAAQALFVDSWEVETRGLWADDFGEAFAKTYGYRIEPHVDSLYAAGRERERYDYHALLSRRVLGFYRDFDSVANARGYLSRAQVSGAPVDLLAGYGAVDVPESEALLFEPTFSRIPASAAAMAGRPLVSAETFTCLYGWPRNHMREEQVADLKLVADQLFAHGVNQIVWHGKAHQPLGSRDTVNFYATVHLGDSSDLAPHLPAFNAYLAGVSRHLRRGRPHYAVAQYLPTEDAWIAGELPRDEQFVWAWGAYEMRDAVAGRGTGLADEAVLWVGPDALAEAAVDTLVRFGEQAVRGVFFDVEYLAPTTVHALLGHAEAGRAVPCLFARRPRLAGTHTPGDSLALDRLLALPSTLIDAAPRASSTGDMYLGSRLIESADALPPHALRVVGDTLLAFFAPEPVRRVAFPLRYGQSDGARVRLAATVRWRGHAAVALDTVGAPGQALLFEIAGGRARALDIGYVPPPPHTVLAEAPERQPWRVRAE